MVVNPHFSGGRLRIRLSNHFGTTPLELDDVTEGMRRKGASLVPRSLRGVRFRGRTRVTIPAGKEAVSDGVRLRVAAFKDLAVSVYVHSASPPSTMQPLTSEVSSYGAPGDRTADRSGARFGSSGALGPFAVSWSYLTDVDVVAPGSAATVVALGDSITNGLGSSEGRGPGKHNTRYPDYLARRFARSKRPLSVVNEGISGAEAPGTLERLDRDVLRVPGVTDVILLEGINDIRHRGASAADVIAGLRMIVARLHAKGLRVVLGTILPYGALEERLNAARVAVNQWIRRMSADDGVLDFDAAVRDPQNPNSMRARYGGAALHPNARGYKRMAEAVPLSLLKGRRCQ